MPFILLHMQTHEPLQRLVCEGASVYFFHRLDFLLQCTHQCPFLPLPFCRLLGSPTILRRPRGRNIAATHRGRSAWSTARFPWTISLIRRVGALLSLPGGIDSCPGTSKSFEENFRPDALGVVCVLLWLCPHGNYSRSRLSPHDRHCVSHRIRPSQSAAVVLDRTRSRA